MSRQDLPIFDLEAQLVESLRDQSRLILQAPTGSGKSTQVPQILLDHGLLGERQVVILQPRRLATRLLAARVATERKGRLGDEVGYQIRFENVTSPRTRIRFVTEGILLRQLIDDPDCATCRRSCSTNFTSAISTATSRWRARLQLQETRRPDLKIVVMSATLETPQSAKISRALRVLTSAGRQHPVAIEYLEKPVRDENYPIWDLAADELARLAPQHGRGRAHLHARKI